MFGLRCEGWVGMSKVKEVSWVGRKIIGRMVWLFIEVFMCVIMCRCVCIYSVDIEIWGFCICMLFFLLLIYFCLGLNGGFVYVRYWVRTFIWIFYRSVLFWRFVLGVVVWIGINILCGFGYIICFVWFRFLYLWIGFRGLFWLFFRMRWFWMCECVYVCVFVWVILGMCVCIFVFICLWVISGCECVRVWVWFVCV